MGQGIQSTPAANPHIDFHKMVASKQQMLINDGTTYFKHEKMQAIDDMKKQRHAGEPQPLLVYDGTQFYTDIEKTNIADTPPRAPLSQSQEIESLKSQLDSAKKLNSNLQVAAAKANKERWDFINSVEDKDMRNNLKQSE